MNRRVPVQNLRGSDATLLDVQLQNLLRRPMGQLAAVNFLDLLALHELEDAPKSIKTQLRGFVERCSTEVAELPPGGFSELLDEVKDITGDRVPNTFRDWMTRESDRPGRDAAQIAALLTTWGEVDPEPFALGERAAKVERGAAAGRRGAASSTRERARSAGKSTTRRSSAAPRRNVGTNTSPEKRAVIEKICMERLNGASDKGLSEVVLVAGVRHRAKTEGYGNVTPAEVTAALKGLKDTSRARFSAGRWMSTARRW